MSFPSSKGSSRQLVFGPFSFDDASGELSKHGTRLRLQGQPLQILTALIRKPGAVVSRDEFRHELWADSTFVDFEHGLNAAMNRLRQVLGDSADRPRYIETLAGRGYRFIATVQDTAANPVLVMAKPAPEDVEVPAPILPQANLRAGKHWPRWIVGVAVGVALTAGLAGGFLAARRQPANPAVHSLRLGITAPDGFAMEAGVSRQTFALSPDGAQLAFTAMDSSGVFQTFMRDLDGMDSRALPDSMGVYHVFWAPDSRSLFQSVNGSVRRIPLTGDSYQVLCDVPALMLSGALKGPDLLISARQANYVVPASGGTPRPLKELYLWMQVLPDGEHVLYTAFDRTSGHFRARIVKWGEPATARDLLETDSRTVYAPSVLTPGTGHLLYVRAGNILAHAFDPRSLRLQGEPIPVVARAYSFIVSGAADFSVSENGILAYRKYLSRSQLAWVNRRGEVLSTIGPANVNLKQARLSPDRKTIATAIFDVNKGGKDIWLIDAETGASRRVATGRGNVENPVWSPDSRKLLFSRAWDGTPKLFIRGLDDHDTDDPLTDSFFQIANDWSPDGRFVAYTNTGFAQMENEMNGDVFLIDLLRNRKLIPLISTPFHEANPAFSPDGHWLAYMSNESGKAEVYVQAFEGGDSPRMIGARHLASHHGALALRWRSDGKELFHLAGDGKLYAVPITLSPVLKIGKPEPLFAISTEAIAAIHSLIGFDVSADGQRLLVPMVTSPERSEIVVIQDWEAAAQRKRGMLN